MRAQSTITPGLAAVENRWMKRVWCGSYGNTLELCTPEDWLHAPGLEFGLAVDEDTLTFRELLDTEWSEFYTREGAGVLVRHSGNGWRVEVRTLALHDAPVLLRQMSVGYFGDGAPQLERIALELLPVHSASEVLLPEDGRRTPDYTAELENDAVVLAGEKGGLLLGALGKVRYQCFEPNPGLCSLVYEPDSAWVPGRLYEMPMTYVGIIQGDVTAQAVTTKEKVTDALRQYLSGRNQA